jgi:hypothetical protein
MLASTITGTTIQLLAGATPVSGTVSYDAALWQARLQPNATLQYGTTYTAIVRGGSTGVTDQAGNPLAADVSWNFTTAAAPQTCPCSIWTTATVPGTPSGSDSQSIEVGVKFVSDTNGYINAIRFYKGSGNTGTHIVNLWRVDGTLLASAPSNTETSVGWQEVPFSSPVTIVAGATYVASYYTSSGHYAGDAGYFASSGWSRARSTRPSAADSSPSRSVTGTDRDP